MKIMYEVEAPPEFFCATTAEGLDSLLRGLARIAPLWQISIKAVRLDKSEGRLSP